MKHHLWTLLLLSSCVRSPHLNRQPDAPYGGTLPTQNGLVYYKSAVSKPGITPNVADSRARNWFQSYGQALDVIEQNPIRRKSDLVYLAFLPSRLVPLDTTEKPKIFPPLRFWVTVDNTGDSSRVFATNFEVMDGKGNFQPIEKEPYSAQERWVSMWLADVDASVTEMMTSLTDLMTQPAKRGTNR